MKPLKKELHIRLYVESALTLNNAVSLDKGQAHYLGQVMRLNVTDRISLFNGRDGEWIAEINQLEKKSGAALPVEQVRPQKEEPNIWFLFAPLKHQKNERLLEQATELGASRIMPLLMRHSIVDKIHHDRWQQHGIEASEQCERMTVPVVSDLQKLDAVFKDWPKDRFLVMGDESGMGQPALEVLKTIPAGSKLALIIGPEGGFAKEEMDMLRALPFAKPVSLGPRIMKADTAAIAALATLQAALGDWQSGKPAFRYAE